MPSEDKFHAENPATNKWLEEAEDSLQTAPTLPGSSSTSTRARATSGTKQAAMIQRLARVTGEDAEALAARIPEDTLRRLKYPVLEQVDPETGLQKFEHDRGIIHDHRQPLLAPDRAHDTIPKGSNGRGAGIGQVRDSIGRFTK